MLHTLDRLSQKGSRGRLITNAILAVICGVFVYVGVTNYLQGETITRITEKSPCFQNPADPECQDTKADSDREQSVKDACIQFDNVNFPCPLTREQRARLEQVIGREAAARIPVSPGTEVSEGSVPDPSVSGSVDVPIAPVPQKPSERPEPSVPVDPAPVVPSPSPEPVPASPVPSALDTILEPVCELTSPLGVCLKVGVR
jgi:hypothetical protein